MAKKKQKELLEGMEDMHKVDEAVQGAADRYAELLQKSNKAKVKRDEANAELIRIMEEFGVEKVWILEGAKCIEHSMVGKVKIVTPKKEDVD